MVFLSSVRYQVDEHRCHALVDLRRNYQYELFAGRGVSIWDKFCHTPGNILSGHTGDVACNSYHKMQDDIRIIRQLGVRTSSLPRLSQLIKDLCLCFELYHTSYTNRMYKYAMLNLTDVLGNRIKRGNLWCRFVVTSSFIYFAL